MSNDENPFDAKTAAIADSMGIALYQQLSFNEASLFLRCSHTDLARLLESQSIACIYVTDTQVNFFGYQLVEYLLSKTQGVYVAEEQGSDDRILRTKEVVDMIGLSRTTIWRLEQKGQFPQRVTLGENSVGWLKSDINEWLKNR